MMVPGRTIHIIMAYAVMAYIVMAYAVMAYIVMAYVVMAWYDDGAEQDYPYRRDRHGRHEEEDCRRNRKPCANTLVFFAAANPGSILVIIKATFQLL